MLATSPETFVVLGKGPLGTEEGAVGVWVVSRGAQALACRGVAEGGGASFVSTALGKAALIAFHPEGVVRAGLAFLLLSTREAQLSHVTTARILFL